MLILRFSENSKLDKIFSKAKKISDRRCLIWRSSSSAKLLFFRTCPCGKTKKTVKCGYPVDCDQICGKTLNCDVHQCKSVCHVGDCDACDVVITQTCFCLQKNVREIVCGSLPAEEIDSGGFRCDQICRKMLTCGNHFCQQPCHPGKVFTAIRLFTDGNLSMMYSQIRKHISSINRIYPEPIWKTALFTYD